MANILWARIPNTHKGGRHNEHEISIRLSYRQEGKDTTKSQADEPTKCYLTFRKGTHDQITNGNGELIEQVNRITCGLSRDGQRLYFMEDKNGKKLTTGGKKAEGSLNRYLIFYKGAFARTGYEKVWEWMCEHPGDYTLKYDDEGFAYITPFEEIKPKNVLWAKRA